MDNYRSVAVSGPVHRARARVIFANGLVKIFDHDGSGIILMSAAPKRVAGHIRKWQATTNRGILNMRGKCITCGGNKWRKVTFMPTKELWESVL